MTDSLSTSGLSVGTMPRSVLIMAGGTGGHVFPALAAADSLRQQGVSVEWLGTRRGIEATLVPAANIPIHYLSVSGFRGKNILSLFKAAVQLLAAIVQAFAVVRRLQPICVLGMGGFASGPGGLVAWLMGRPLVIHEQNAVPGTANRILARLARRVLHGYPIELGGAKGEHVGNPVRADIASVVAPELRGVGESARLKVLVLGGSLGARPINDVLPRAMLEMPAERRPLLWHQTGKQHIDAVIDSYSKAGLEVKAEAFIEDMAAAYSWADLVVCRAGALTVAELAAVGVASILVPLPYAIDDHQTENARWLSDNDAGILLVQSKMTAQSLSALWEEFTNDSPRLLAMAMAARKLAKTDAAERVATVCLEVANG